VSGARARVHGESNAGGAFEEVSGELVHRITEAKHAARDPAPLNVQGLDLCTYGIAQWTGGSKAIRHSEGVKNRTDVSRVQPCPASVEISSSAAYRDWTRPQHQCRRDSGIIRMQAQRARGRLAVNSYERESALMGRAVCSNKLALHEPNIGIESIGGTVARLKVRAGPSKG
jgi:hypothetical protein